MFTGIGPTATPPRTSNGLAPRPPPAEFSRPNGSNTYGTGLYGSGEPMVVELERLKRKYKEQQQRLSHSSVTPAPAGAPPSSTGPRGTTPVLPSITGANVKVTPPAQRSYVPPARGASSSPAIAPNGLSPGLPGVPRKELRLASLMNANSVPPEWSPPPPRPPISRALEDDDDEEVKKLLAKLRQSQERIDQRTTQLNAEWVKHHMDEKNMSVASQHSDTWNQDTNVMDTSSLLCTTTDNIENAHLVKNTAMYRSTSQFFTALQKFQAKHESDAGLEGEMGSVDMDSIGAISMRKVGQEWAQHRDGSVLSATTILRRDRDEFAATAAAMLSVTSQIDQHRTHIMSLSGCPLFRMIRKMNLAAVGQPSAVGIASILNEMHMQSKNNIVWINLREEATVYVNGYSHTLCDCTPPFEGLRMQGIKVTRLEAMETRLRSDILEESQRHCGSVALHYADAYKSVWEAVDETTVITTGDLFRKVHKGISYFRVPIGPKSSPTFEDIDVLISITLQHPTEVIVVNCHSGRGRSTTAMMVAALIRSFTHSNTFLPPVPVNRGKMSLGSSRFRALRRLLSLFPAGTEYEARVESIGNLCGGVVGQLRDKVEQLMGSPVQELFHKGLMLLERYCVFIALCAYLDERFGRRRSSANVPPTVTFTQWMKDHLEVRLVLKDVTDQLENVFKERARTPGMPGTSLSTAEADLQYIETRAGEVLGPHMVLRDVGDEITPTATSHVDPIEGVARFRAVAPDLHIYTASACDPCAVGALAMHISATIPPGVTHKIHWLNVGIEPVVFLHQRPYALHDHLDGNDIIIRGVSSDRLAQMEDRLKNDVLAEAAANGGTILVHTAHGTGHITVNPEDVLTPKEMVSVASGTSNVRLHYIRFPTPPHNYLPSLAEIHSFMMLVESLRCTGNSSLIITNRSGAGHSTMLLCLAALVQLRMASSLSQCTSPGIVYTKLTDVHKTDTEVEHIIESSGRLDENNAPDESADGGDVRLAVASKLTQIIGKKTLHDVVDTIVGLCGKGSAWNLKHAVRAYHKKAEHTEDQQVAAVYTTMAVINVQKYCLLLIAAAYLEEVGLTPSPTLEEWMQSREEIMTRFEHMPDHPEEALQIIQAFTIPVMHKPSFSQMSRSRRGTLTVAEGAIHNRKGNILGANSGLKADHFPGCQKKDILPALLGAPNFRKVDFVNVYGCGIPTISGIQNVCALLGASDTKLEGGTEGYRSVLPNHGLFYNPALVSDNIAPLSVSQRSRENILGPGYIVWLNLREEPIMYVNDRPFVFRDLSQPYVNVEITGIESNSVERIEEILREDVLTEATTCDGQLLLHDEGKPCELIGVWEGVTPETVRTIRGVYETVRIAGTRVEFHRIPVTDEQSPEHKDFDSIIAALLRWVRTALQQGETRRVSFVFNCQMGRGRTTTGMVVCVLLLMHVCPEYLMVLESKYGCPAPSTAKGPDYGRGEYKCIIGLVRALQDGRKAKQLADLAIDTCERMQNLRTAIEVFKKAVESPDTSEEGRGRSLHHGVNYLKRYFHLICLCSYIGECFDPHSTEISHAFTDWMKERPELTVLHDQAALD